MKMRTVSINVIEEIIERFIAERRSSARRESDAFRKLPSLQLAIHHAARCHRLPSTKRHSHQCRIPGGVLQEVERTLQAAASRLSRCKNFEALHDEVASLIKGIRKIGNLAIYDISHRIGIYLGKRPRLVYLHRGTALGARYLGFTGAVLDPALLPPAFSRLQPEEIEDCLCIYKAELAGLSSNGFDRSCGVSSSTARRRTRCGNTIKVRRKVC